MSPYNRNQTYDPNIIEALEKLPPVMHNNEGISVTVRKTAYKETGVEHIAGSHHGLQVRDIEIVPNVLKSPLVVSPDPKKKNNKNYYGKRKGAHERDIYVKIVTNIRPNKTEEIVTIFPVDKIKK